MQGLEYVTHFKEVIYRSALLEALNALYNKLSTTDVEELYADDADEIDDNPWIDLKIDDRLGK